MAEIQLPPLELHTFQWVVGDLVDDEGVLQKKVLVFHLPPPFYPRVHFILDPEKASEMAAQLEGRRVITATQIPNGLPDLNDIHIPK
jgi:hypothetical protein